MQLADVGLDELLAEAHLLELALDVLGAVGVLGLQPGVQDDVGEDAAAEAVAQREQVAQLARLDAVQAAPQPGLVGDPAEGAQHERVEVEHAELAVADPRLAGPQRLEGADVDERRPRAAELHVVGRGVLQDQVARQGGLQQLELQERRVLEHPEGPLVGVRDERDRLVA